MHVPYLDRVMVTWLEQNSSNGALSKRLKLGLQANILESTRLQKRDTFGFSCIFKANEAFLLERIKHIRLITKHGL